VLGPVGDQEERDFPRQLGLPPGVSDLWILHQPVMDPPVWDQLGHYLPPSSRRRASRAARSNPRGSTCASGAMAAMTKATASLVQRTPATPSASGSQLAQPSMAVDGALVRVGKLWTERGKLLDGMVECSHSTVHMRGL
jgi:hypothetical protein